MKTTFPTAWGLLGKHPSRADFVRVNVLSETAIEFHRFLELGVELLHRRRQPLTLEPTRFVFAPRAQGPVLVGVMKASVDSIGRHFPLAAFLEFSADQVPASVAELPFFAAEALQAAQRLLSEQAQSTEPLDAKLQALPLPTANAQAAARTEHDQSLAPVLVSALQALFSAGPALGGTWYAVKTVLLACDARRKPASGAPTLECPLSPEFGAAPWLAIVARGNPGAPVPTLMWNASRLYVALGALPAAIFPGLVGAPVQATNVWPVSTTQQGAIDSARASLRAAPLLASPEATLLDALGPLGGKR